MVDLQRFVTAQAPVYETVCRELGSGRKATHWMWFIFPQLAALGHSSTAKFYGLADVAEAAAFASHSVLGPRLVECCTLMRRHAGKGAVGVLGDVDGMKWRSCLTLFARTPGASPLFDDLLMTFYDGVPDPHTLTLLA